MPERFEIYIVYKRRYIQTVLDIIYAWATEWQLQVSVEKCAILKIGNVSDNNDYYIKIFATAKCHVLP